MVDNPKHNPTGDFTIDEQGLAQHKISEKPNSNTFSGIALYHKSLFLKLNSGVKALAPVFRSLIDAQQLQADYYAGTWTDVGTPERLALLCKKAEPQLKPDI